MSSKNQSEDHGIRNKGSCYTTLKNAWEYSCPKTNINFSGFSGGVNCLCLGTHKERSSGDVAVITGQKWPVANPSLGWRT